MIFVHKQKRLLNPDNILPRRLNKTLIYPNKRSIFIPVMTLNVSEYANKRKRAPTIKIDHKFVPSGISNFFPRLELSGLKTRVVWKTTID